jgi:hypothetical protein
MTLPSNGLRIDHIVLAVRADEPDVDDPIGVVDPNDDAILMPAMLKTARPSLRMLALRMARFTSAGVAQSAPLTCRYQAITGSRASAYIGLRLMKALSVLSAMILTITNLA